MRGLGCVASPILTGGDSNLTQTGDLPDQRGAETRYADVPSKTKMICNSGPKVQHDYIGTAIEDSKAYAGLRTSWTESRQ